MAKYEKAKTIRREFEELYDEIFEYCLPQRQGFKNYTPGQRRDDRIFDETAVVGVQEFASRLQSGLVPNFARWADFVAGGEVPPEEADEINNKLDEVTNYVFEINFGFSVVKVFYIRNGNNNVQVIRVKKRAPLLTILLILVFLVSAVCGFSSTARAAEIWSQTYGGPATEICFSAVETNDGGYALVGYTYSFGSGDADIWIVKTDPNGNMEWNRTFGTQNHEDASHLIATDDGGYIIVGTYTPIGFDNRDVWLIKTDSTGNIEWNKTYGGNGDDKPWRIVKTSDYGYAIAGRTSSYSQGQNDYLLFKIDSTGNLQWNTTFGGAEEESARGILETPDKGFLITGWSGSYGAGELDFWLVKTDGNGKHEWNQTYGGTKTERAITTILTNDGNYITVGNSASFGQGETDILLVKIDNSGNQIWNVTYGGKSAETPFGIIEALDGGYGIVGHSFSFGAGEDDVWFIKTDSNGNMVFNQTFGGEPADSARTIMQGTDGGYIIAGSTASFGQGENDFWLVKIDETGEMPDFPLWIILLLFLIATLIVIMCRKRMKN